MYCHVNFHLVVTLLTTGGVCRLTWCKASACNFWIWTQLRLRFQMIRFKCLGGWMHYQWTFFSRFFTQMFVNCSFMKKKKHCEYPSKHLLCCTEERAIQAHWKLDVVQQLESEMCNEWQQKYSVLSQIDSAFYYAGCYTFCRNLETKYPVSGAKKLMLYHIWT